MASSSLINLVNIILRTTGDASEIVDTAATTDVANATGGIGKRTTDFINLVIDKIEKSHNWAALRVDSTGTTDGVEDTYEFVGVQEMKSGGPVSVWVSDLGRLEEVTAEQFDKLKAEGGTAQGVPVYFQRQVSAAGNMQVQLYPLPATGYTLNISGYRRATKFTQPPVDTETTDFDDALIVTGVLMHIDMYDGMSRGYRALFGDALATAKLEAISNRQIRVEVEKYNQ